MALLWLPAGVVAQAVMRFASGSGDAPGAGLEALLAGVGSLVLVAACDLPLALGCRRLWRLHYRRLAWVIGIGLGGLTVAASVVAGLLGPVAIARPCHSAQSAGMGRLVLAGTEGLRADRVGPAAQQGSRLVRFMDGFMVRSEGRGVHGKGMQRGLYRMFPARSLNAIQASSK